MKKRNQMITAKEIFYKHDDNIEFIKSALLMLCRDDVSTDGMVIWPIILEIQHKFWALVKDLKGE